MSVIEFSPQAWPKQDECIRLLSADSGKEVVGYGGAKGGGKSHLARTWQVMRRIKYKNSRGLLIRETYPELYHSQIDKLRRELPAELYEYADSKHEFRFTNGAVLEMGYIERAEDVYSRYWGAEYDDISIDECQNQDKKTFQLLKTCLRTTNPYIKVKMLLTFNWGGIGHAWLKKMFWRKWMKDNALESGIEDTWDNPQHWDDGENPALHAFVHAKVYDNPSITKNDPGYIERLKALPESLRKAYLDGDPDVFEGQFFTEFGTHLREKPFEIQESDLRDRLFFSLDSGTTHATSGGLWWISPKHLNKQFGYDYSLHRLFSYLAYGGTIDKHAREIFNRLESFPWSKGRFPDRLYYDPSMDTKQKLNEAMVRSAIDEYKDVFSGKPTVFIPANNDKVNGCQIMKLLFSGSNKYAPMRYWTGYNTSFEEGIASAVYDKNNKEIYQKRDGDDACFSGDTKIKTTDGDIEISKLVDKKVEVFTIDGVKKTNGSFITGMNRKIIKLTFSDGSIIKCTPDHLFLNKNKKWIKAVDFLDETSYIVDERRYDVCLLEKTVKHAKSSMGCDIIFVDIISKDHQKKRPGLKYYIGMYEYHFGKIPIGWNVHHIDENVRNNQIDNFRILPASQHLSLHSSKPENVEKSRKSIKKAIIAAAIWHGSAEGKKWHSEHYEKNIRKNLSIKITKECIVCGKKYQTLYSLRNYSRYCHQNCKAIALRRRRKCGL